MQNRSMHDSGTFDALTQFKDAGALTASAAATVGGQARIVDLGASLMPADLIVDVNAIDTGTGDENYRIQLQFSNSSTFASGIVNGTAMFLGGATATGASAADTAGRYRLPLYNEINGTAYRYARLYVAIAGTTPSIDFVAFAVRDAD